jgi:RNase P subunit RPR2
MWPTPETVNAIEMLVEEFPAPVCQACLAPMWLKKKVHCGTRPYHFTRIGFECRGCGSKVRLGSHAPVIAAAGTAAK